MNLYLDASVLVAIFSQDHWTADALRLLAQLEAPPVVSDFAAAEFAAVIARKVRATDQPREQRLSQAEAAEVFRHFDHWATVNTLRNGVLPQDIATAETWLRRMEPRLRTPDALNLALAFRLNLPVATFDKGMAAAARALGLALALP